jgi:hypothetical protein
MNQKPWQLLCGFVILYYMVNLVQDIPNLVNGSHRFNYLPDTFRHLLHRISQMILLSGFAFTSYFALLQLYPRQTVLAVFFMH